MNRLGKSFGLAALPIAFTLAGQGHLAQAQSTRAGSDLRGTWQLVLVDNVYPDGRRVQLYGPDPQGLLMFDEDGRYSLQILRAQRPRFASNDKAQGTAEEYQAAVQGSNAHFGRYVVDPNGRTITFRIEHASFPNWEGTEQKRAFVLSGDELKYTVPVPTSGANALGEVVWKRVR